MDALQGNFRVNENLELIGWVRDPARPHDSVEIDVLVNNQRVTTTVADRPRPDMADRFDFTRIGIHLDLAAFGDVAPGEWRAQTSSFIGRLPDNRLVLWS